jgi:hypothetical protein
VTFNDLAAQAMREIGVLAQGELPTADETADAFTRANFMLDAWNSERLLVFTIQRQIFSLTPSKQAYTMGTGGDFNTLRPARIDRVSILSLNNPVQPLELPVEYLTDERWSAIPVKNIQSSLPQAVWDDQGFPLRTLSFWCIPNVTVQVALYTWTALAQFPDYVTDEKYPPGYAEALVYNLALRLAPSFGVAQINPVTAAAATAAITRIKGMNAPVIDLYCDSALVPNRQRYNWLTDNANARGGRF